MDVENRDVNATDMPISDCLDFVYVLYDLKYMVVYVICNPPEIYYMFHRGNYDTIYNFMYGQLVLLILGILGNTLSLIVWSIGPKCKKLACSLNFRLLALADIIAIVIFIITHEQSKWWLEYMTRSWFGPLSKISSDIAIWTSPWIIVTLSVERTLSIMFPLKFKEQSTRATWISFGCVVTIPVIYDISFALVEFVGWSSIDEHIMGYKALLHKIQAALDTFMLMMPLVVIVVCDVLILVQLILRSKLKSYAGSRRQKQLFTAFSLLTIVTGLVHSITIIPWVIAKIRVTYFPVYFFDGNHFLNINYRRTLFWLDFTDTAKYLNSSLNFYVYCLIGRDFRNDLKYIFKSCFSNMKHQLETTTVTV